MFLSCFICFQQSFLCEFCCYFVGKYFFHSFVIIYLCFQLNSTQIFNKFSALIWKATQILRHFLLLYELPTVGQESSEQIRWNGRNQEHFWCMLDMLATRKTMKLSLEIIVKTGKIAIIIVGFEKRNIILKKKNYNLDVQRIKVNI